VSAAEPTVQENATEAVFMKLAGAAGVEGVAGIDTDYEDYRDARFGDGGGILAAAALLSGDCDIINNFSGMHFIFGL